MSRHPWNQLPEETHNAYQAFLLYLHAGPGRRITHVQKQTNNTSPMSWSQHYDWSARATAFDLHMAEIQLAASEKAIEDAANANAAEWARLETEARRLRVQIRQKLLKRVDEIMSKPTSEETIEREVKDDKGNIIQQTVIIKPTPDATFSAAARMIELDAKLERLESGEATEIVEVRAQHDWREVLLMPESYKDRIRSGREFPMDVLADWIRDGRPQVVDITQGIVQGDDDGEEPGDEPETDGA